MAADMPAALISDAEAAEIERLTAKRRRTAAENTTLRLVLAAGRTRAERLANGAWLDSLSIDDLARLETALAGEGWDVAEIDAVIRAYPALPRP